VYSHRDCAQSLYENDDVAEDDDHDHDHDDHNQELVFLFPLLFFIAALGMSLCVAFIALVRLPSLKVSTLLLVGLVLYDVFWVSSCRRSGSSHSWSSRLTQCGMRLMVASRELVTVAPKQAFVPRFYYLFSGMRDVSPELIDWLIRLLCVVCCCKVLLF